MKTHFITLVFVTIVVILKIGSSYSQFPEDNQFVPTVIPRDPNQARQLLGYNKYDRSQVKDSDQKVLYGNNWEQFAK